jgi:hypothetical protein
MSTPLDPDELATLIVRAMKPELQKEFLASPEFRSIAPELRERFYEADARLEERERKYRRGRA